MSVKIGMRCASQGKALVEVKMPQVEGIATVCASARLDSGADIPVECKPSCQDGSFVLALPALKGQSCHVLLDCVDDQGVLIAREDVKLGFKGMTAHSALTALSRGASQDDLLRTVSKFDSVSPLLSFCWAIQDGAERVVRLQAVVPGAMDNPCFEGFASDGSSLNLDYVVLEDSTGNFGPVDIHARVMTLSFRIPDSISCFGVRLRAQGEISQAFAYLDGVAYQKLIGASLGQVSSVEHDPRYAQWAKERQLATRELGEQSKIQFPLRPCFSIVVPLYKTPIPFFEDMVRSVRMQSYSNWELILVNASPDDTKLSKALQHRVDGRIKVISLEENLGIAENTNRGIEAAKGDFVAFLDHDDRLSLDALFEYAKAINEYPEIDVLYSDEDKFDQSGVFSNPFFKPDFSPDLLRSQNYVTHFLAIRRTLLESIGFEDAAFDGAQDYDLTLRATESARCVKHVPKVLYHWRLHAGSTSQNSDSKSYAKEAGRRAVMAHCARQGVKASIEDTTLPFAFHTKCHMEDCPLVSVIIPNKDQAALLSSCLDSLLNKATYRNIEVIVVENNSVETQTFDYYQRVQEQDSRVCVVNWTEEFNYSNVVNYGVSFARGDYLLFLNNDTEVITPDFLEEMLGYFAFSTTGVVGAKLLYKDGLVQHGGAALGPFGDAGHLFQNMPENAEGYYCRNLLTQNLSVVTGACQLVKRSVFDLVGGYDPSFQVAFNDVDFCLKVREVGYQVVYTPFAKLYHYEFASRGRDQSAARRMRVEREHGLLHYRWPKYFTQGDPFVGPNIDPLSINFGLRDAIHTSRIRRVINALRG